MTMLPRPRQACYKCQGSPIGWLRRHAYCQSQGIPHGPAAKARLLTRPRYSPGHAAVAKAKPTPISLLLIQAFYQGQGSPMDTQPRLRHSFVHASKGKVCMLPMRRQPPCAGCQGMHADKAKVWSPQGQGTPRWAHCQGQGSPMVSLQRQRNVALGTLPMPRHAFFQGQGIPIGFRVLGFRV